MRALKITRDASYSLPELFVSTEGLYKERRISSLRRPLHSFEIPPSQACVWTCIFVLSSWPLFLLSLAVSWQKREWEPSLGEVARDRPLPTQLPTTTRAGRKSLNCDHLPTFSRLTAPETKSGSDQTWRSVTNDVISVKIPFGLHRLGLTVGIVPHLVTGGSSCSV